MARTKPQDTREIDQLRAAVRRGARAKYVFFWSHKSVGAGITSACLSQWYPAPFSVDGSRYPTSEHFMMAEKARVFGDSESELRILSAPNPGAAKRFGREVRGFDQRIWDSRRWGIAIAGNLAKFTQNPKLSEFLLGTGRRVLVEASPVDSIWGVGLAVDDEGIENPEQWRGLNLLGFALMEVRSILHGSRQTDSAAGGAERLLATDGPLRGPQLK